MQWPSFGKKSSQNLIVPQFDDLNEITCLDYESKLEPFLNQLLGSDVNRNLRNKYKFMIRFYLLKGLCRDLKMNANRRIKIIDEMGRKKIRFFDRNHVFTSRTGNNKAEYVDLLKTDVDIFVEMTPFLSYKLAQALKKNVLNYDIENYQQKTIEVKKFEIIQTTLLNVPSMSTFSDILYFKPYLVMFGELIGYLILFAIIGGIIWAIISATGGIAILGILPFMRGSTSVRGSNNIRYYSKSIIKLEDIQEELKNFINNIVKIYNKIMYQLYSKKFSFFEDKIITIGEKTDLVNAYDINLEDQNMQVFLVNITMEVGKELTTIQNNILIYVYRIDCKDEDCENHKKLFRELLERNLDKIKRMRNSNIYKIYKEFNTEYDRWYRNGKEMMDRKKQKEQSPLHSVNGGKKKKITKKKISKK